MFDYIRSVLSNISIPHLNVLLLLGLALFGGTIGGRLFQKLRIPQVVGYIAIGVIIGQSGLDIVDNDIIEALKPFNYFALGLIGFLVGGELKKEVFQKYGRQLIYILLCEGIAPFLLVTLSVGFIGSFLFGSKPFIWALALLMGAISSATDPATSTSVLREYKTRGPLSTAILGIVALDDGLALLLFAIASTIAGTLIGLSGNGSLANLIHPFYEILGAVFVGGISGIVLTSILKRYSEKERVLAFSVGMVLLVTGISIAINVSMLLTLMTLGIIVVNFMPQKSKDAFSIVEGFTPPIYVLFFVLVGAKLEFKHMTPFILVLVVIYLFFTILGKAVGSNIGARLSKAPKTVRKYLPFSLFSQAGVAIGLSILAAHHFPANIGNTLVIIITATTFITQLAGPPLIKFAVIKAKEAGLNITEEDIVEKTTAEEVMDKKPPLIYENMQLNDILKIFSENDSLYYPVINKDRELLGIITVEGIKQTFLETDISGLILANDLMEPVLCTISSKASIYDVRKALDRHNIEYLPVVDKGNKIQGFIERKKLNRFISTKIIELQRQADSLELAT